MGEPTAVVKRFFPPVHPWIGRLLLVLSVILMALSVTWNPWEFAVPRAVGSFQKDSDAWTLGKVARVAAHPLDPAVWIEPQCRAAGERATAIVATYVAFPRDVCGNVYTGNVGLQATPLGWITVALDRLGLQGREMFEVLRILLRATTAVLLAVLVLCLARRVSVAAAVGLAVAVSVSPWVLYFAGSLYWLLPSWLLPIVLIAWLARPEQPLGLSPAGLAGLGLALTARLVSGFEYAPAICGSALVALLVFGHDFSAPVTVASGWRRWLKQGGATVAVSVVAVVAATVLHVLAMSAHYGTIALAWGNFLDRVLYRTVDVGQNLSVDLRSSLSHSRLEVLTHYVLEPDVALGLNAAWLLLLLGGLSLLLRLLRPRGLPVLVLLLGLSFVVSGSWHVLASGHSWIHRTMNPVLWLFPLFPLLGAVCVHTVVRVVDEAIAAGQRRFGVG